MYTSQPQTVAGVDWGNQLADGLQALHDCNNRVDSVSQRGLVMYGEVSRDVGKYVGSKGTALASSSALTNPAMTSRGKNQTIFCCFYQPSIPQYYSYVCGEAIGNSYFGLSCYHDGGKTGLFFGTNSILYGGILSAGIHTLTGTLSNNSVVKLYIDGRVSASTGIAPIALGSSLLSSCAINSSIGSSISTIYLSALFNRCLSDSEVFSLSANPWQLFKQPSHRLFIPASLPWFLVAPLYEKVINNPPQGVLLYNSLFMPTHEKVLDVLPQYVLPYNDLLAPTHNKVLDNPTQYVELAITLTNNTFTALNEYLTQYLYPEVFYHPSVERTFNVTLESRVFSMSAESRSLTIPQESRLYNVPVK